MVATTMSDSELGVKCMNVLIDGVGPVDAERFISIVNREHFDYTEWQKNLFAGETVQSLGEKIMAYEPSTDLYRNVMKGANRSSKRYRQG